jgi:hypothetical protein
MRQLVRQPSMPPMPGWGPISPPTRPQRQHNWAATAVREVVIFGGLSVLFARTGLVTGPPIILTVLVTRGLIGILFWCRASGGWREVARVLVAGVAIAALAVLAVGTPTAPAKAKPKPKVVKVEAAQADQLEHARTIWGQVWEQVATAYSKATQEGAK